MPCFVYNLHLLKFQTCPFKVISTSDTIDTIVFKNSRLVDQTEGTQNRLEYKVTYRVVEIRDEQKI